MTKLTKNKTVRELLLELAEPEYADFVAKGAPSDYPVLGVRVPKLQGIANDIFKSGTADEFLASLEPRSREEVHLRSLVLALKIEKEGISVYKDELFEQILKMDSWEMVDAICSRLKSVKRHREEWLILIDEMLETNRKIREDRGENGEYFVRTGLVLLLNYYVEVDWIQVVFERILKVINREEYYIKMATAWLIQKCYVSYPDLTFSFLKTNAMPDFVLRKAVSKIQDSYRVDEEWKMKAKNLIRRENVACTEK